MRQGCSSSQSQSRKANRIAKVKAFVDPIASKVKGGRSWAKGFLLDSTSSPRGSPPHATHGSARDNHRRERNHHHGLTSQVTTPHRGRKSRTTPGRGRSPSWLKTHSELCLRGCTPAARHGHARWFSFRLLATNQVRLRVHGAPKTVAPLARYAERSLSRPAVEVPRGVPHVWAQAPKPAAAVVARAPGGRPCAPQNVTAAHPRSLQVATYAAIKSRNGSRASRGHSGRSRPAWRNGGAPPVTPRCGRRQGAEAG